MSAAGIIILFIIVTFFAMLLLFTVLGCIGRAKLKDNGKILIKCAKCKSKMDKIDERYYLIPVYFDNEHEDTAQYYIDNAVRVSPDDQVPTGQRTCKVELLRCPECGYKKVEIYEFIKTTMGQTNVDYNAFDYNQISSLFES